MNIKFAELSRQYHKYQIEYEEAALRVLRSGWYILGNELDKFENDFASFLDAQYCIGVGNGLDALRLALQGFDIGKGDEVIVQANTFIATALAITQNEAIPVFVDADEFFGIRPSDIESAITERTKAIIVVHLYGHPCDMDPIIEIAKKHNLILVEDCAQSHGAKYKGKMCGTFGDIACFSFYPMKPIGVFGDGGAVVTNNAVVAQKIRKLHNYGSTTKYIHEVLGMNSRLDEIQAAIGIINLKYVSKGNIERNSIARKYIDGISNPKIKIPPIRDGSYSSYHIFPILSEDRNRLKNYLEQNGIQTQIHYPIPCHLAECYKQLGYYKGDFPVTEYYADSEISLPIYVGLSEIEIDYIITIVNSFV